MAANAICFQIVLASESALDFRMIIFFLTFQSLVSTQRLLSLELDGK
jgi:hypothetical protein